MSKKEKFIEVVGELFRKTDMVTFAGDNYEDVMTYFEALKGGQDKEKPLFTENGKLILDFMKNNRETYNNLFTAKAMGEGMGLSSRTVSGACRKLVTDGFIEKVGESPISYSLTSKGMEIVG